MYIWAEGDTPALEEEAQKMAFGILAEAYPGYNWWVRAYKGGFFIREMSFPDNWGMNFPRANSIYSASEYKKKVVMLAGEWLERANLIRGKSRGDEEYQVEGVKEKKVIHTPKVIVPGEIREESLRG